MDTLRYVWRLLVDAGKLWMECNAFSYAGSLAFYTLFSLAPTVIIAVSVASVVLGEAAAQGQIVAEFQSVMGNDAASLIEEAVANSRIEANGILPTVAGIAALMVGATTVFAQLQYSLNDIWGVKPKPSRNSFFLFLRKRFFSLMLVVSIGFILLVSLVLGVVLRAMLDFTVQLLPAVEMLISSTEAVLSFVVITLLFAAIFKVLPDVVLGWRQVLIGAVVTALLFSLGRFGIASYLAYQAPDSTYGAAGAIVLILMWVYYSSLILLFGAAFSRVHLLARGQEIKPRAAAVRVNTETSEKGSSNNV
ncbi:MAG TPA: YihY/virulence factor BrkB family protein [Pseudohongiella sp.]|nr:ribonuclease BN [Pseudohongiella sp.]HBX37017.1 YihY/virulence factor BrkB family protein [Pseudohongiella sp.]|tara:strand:+ start:15040 stop:15957 length:918 start_codon:yes stop_codon:yes gene_type:complete